MKVFLVSFPSDVSVLSRITNKGKNDILLSYFFIQEEKVVLKEIMRKWGVLENENK